LCTRVRTGRIVDEVVDTREPGVVSVVGEEVASAAESLNVMHRSPFDRFDVRMAIAEPANTEGLGLEKYEIVDDFVAVLNEAHEAIFPGMAEQEFQQDAVSLAVDPQEREMDATFLQFPVVQDRLPPVREVYKSKLKTYNVEKRTQTLSETLSALTARNLSAPNISMVQNEGAMVLEVWNNFLDMACVPDARGRIEAWREDVTVLESESFLEWTKKAKPDTLVAMRKEMEAMGKAFEEYDVGQYLAMLKSDAKPPLSDKPIHEQIAPQVIVYHEKVLSAFYSSIFRVIARRFMSLLRPEWLATLRKDVKDVAAFIAANHPWGEEGLKYLENDFGKFDKSQDRFVFILEAYVFEQLGFNDELLERWLRGHERCNIRALSLGLVLHVEWQRKSGDATTALGNVILNMLSVCYAYRGTVVRWAVFMGDDSVVCSSCVVASRESLDSLAQVFNLSAKFFVNNYVYFASHFYLLDCESQQVYAVPDGVKRAQRWAVSVSVKDPRWDEKFVSNRDACRIYLHSDKLVGLTEAVRTRYGVSQNVDLDTFHAAVATVISSRDRMRSVWEERVTLING